MPVKRITFPGHDGARLSARLDLPREPHVATAIFAHCFTCGKDIAAARRIADRLAALGIAILRFDFTGLGHSEGEFSNTSFTSNVDDLIAANSYLAAKGMTPSLIIGHSLGGAAVLKAAAALDTIKAVVTIGAPFDPGHVTHNFAGALAEIKTKGVAEVNLGGRPFMIGKDFVQDVSEAQLGPAISQLKAALLVLHAPRDSVVGIENAGNIFAAAKHPKSFVTLDGADHLVSTAADAEYVANLIATWSERYLDISRPAPPPGAPEGVLRVTEADPTGFLTDITSGEGHHLIADEPMAYGGTNKGLSPYGLLSAGLGACTSMTIRMYARRKGWPLEQVSVDVSHDKVHAQDAQTAIGEKIDTWRRRITLSGALTTEHRSRLLQIADKCPVHRTLERSSRVITELVEPDA